MSGGPFALPALGIDGFERPLWAVALLLLGTLALWRAIRSAPPALAWSALAEARAAGARRFDGVALLAHVLRAGALGCLALAVAGPVSLQARRAELEGLDLVLALDTSGSMRALDAQIGGEWRTRLDLARSVVGRFAAERVAEGDRVGLVVFGDEAFTQSPLTRDGRLLGAALGRVRAGMAGEATALGDALALAVRRVTPGAGEQAGPAAAGAPRAGRLVVLLTDGRANAGVVPVDIAAALAAARGIRVHTVGIGGEGEVAIESAAPGAPRGLRFERHDLDAATLRQIAERSGGRFFRARRPEDLEAVYAEIDALERTARPAPPERFATPRPEPLLGLAGVLLLMEIGGARVLARRLP